MYRARYVLVDQALRGRGMRSTECPSYYYYYIHSLIVNVVTQNFCPLAAIAIFNHVSPATQISCLWEHE